VPLPSPAGAGEASSRRNRRTPSTDKSARADSPAVVPALVACTSTVPGVPSGKRTITHGTPRTLRRPSTASRAPHSGWCAAVTVTSSGSDERNSRSL